jgi:hypothetical protein
MNWLPFLGPGIPIGIAVFRRYQAHQVAKQYEGIYAPEIIDGRATRQMPGASLTQLRASGMFSRNPRVLAGDAYDSTPEGKREHDSYIVTDPLHPTYAARTVVYREGFEVSQQKIELIDKNILVRPSEPGYNDHRLRRLHGPLYLDW